MPTDDLFPLDPTMRQRDEFETRLMHLIADLRMTRPPARRLQLRHDSQAILEQWLKLTGQTADKEEIEMRIKSRNAARQWQHTEWEPEPFTKL